MHREARTQLDQHFQYRNQGRPLHQGFFQLDHRVSSHFPCPVPCPPDPQVVSVDCNPAQSALLELKAVAIRELEFEDCWQLFGEGLHPHIQGRSTWMVKHETCKWRIPGLAGQNRTPSPACDVHLLCNNLPVLGTVMAGPPAVIE